VAVLGAAGLGACAVLAACSPVQVGAAAIVGDQRITVSSLDSQVSNLQEAVKPYGSSLPITTSEMPSEVLAWLIRFDVWDQTAAANGISVTKSQADAGLSSLDSTAQSNGFTSTSELLLANGVPPQLFPQVGQWVAQQTAYQLKVNGGKQVTTQTQQTNVENATTKAECTAAKSLNIQVSPQFGRLDYTQFTVVPAANTLSQPEGVPSPASTEGLTPAC
jgi:hypothetical protein